MLTLAKLKTCTLILDFSNEAMGTVNRRLNSHGSDVADARMVDPTLDRGVDPPFNMVCNLVATTGVIRGGSSTCVSDVRLRLGMVCMYNRNMWQH